MTLGLRAKPDVNLRVVATRDQLNADGTIPSENRLAGIEAVPLPLSSNAMELAWWVLNAPKIERYTGQVDWVYTAKNEIVSVRPGTKFAVTFHGVHECDPQLERRSGYREAMNVLRWKKQYALLVKRGRLILTVSEFLKRQIVEMFGANPNRVAIVGNGVEQVFFDAANLPGGASGQPTDRPFVLCVGGLNHLDGAQFTLPVAQELLKRDPAIRILVAGYDNQSPYTDRAQELPNVELLGYVPAPQLAKLMRDAACFLFLSRYETFGIAGAEAMAVGTPLIASNLTAVPEVVGDGGVVVDPTQTGRIADLVIELVRSSGLREQFRQRGMRRAQQYTWDACVERLYQALKTF
jgi:glycosyltransferase involved in cell wall biosynthesis